MKKEKPIEETELECEDCGYEGVNWKFMKPTKNTLSFRAKCPKCKKSSNFMAFGSK